MFRLPRIVGVEGRDEPPPESVSTGDWHSTILFKQAFYSHPHLTEFRTCITYSPLIFKNRPATVAEKRIQSSLGSRICELQMVEGGGGVDVRCQRPAPPFS
jgi:hypothetical protein